MVTRISCREDVRLRRPGLFRRRQVQIAREEVAGAGVVVALFAHAFEHERVLGRLGVLQWPGPR